MPYVDQGQPKAPMSLPPILPVILAVIMAGVGAASWLGSFKWFGMSYPGAIITGLLIGLAIKFTLNQPLPPLRILAIVLTVLASVAGYVWVFAMFYTNFSLSASIAAFFRDFTALIMVGFGCYIAFALASPRAPRASNQ